jgi:hypothetical protein
MHYQQYHHHQLWNKKDEVPVLKHHIKTSIGVGFHAFLISALTN